MSFSNAQQPINYNQNNYSFEQEPLNCSIGLENILQTLFNITNMRNANLIFDTLIINALTMTRNCMDKNNLNVDYIGNKVKQDISQLLMYFTQYVTASSISPFIDTPYIIIYNPVYRLPVINRRKLTTTNRHILEFTNKIFKSICTRPPYMVDMDHYKLYGIIAGMKSYVHQDINHFIQNTCNIHARKLATRQYLLISHCAMDFHLADNLKDRLTLLESFTGKLRTPNEFGKKVFGEVGVPFNKYTHALFGDNTHVHQLAYRKDKKTLYDLSRKNRWDIKPLSSIRTDIKNTGIIPIDLVSSFNF